jgi:2-polyprenyl-6-hydroxyphenyl methylase/3-demethylubiquinone-9 3-methyltransferase
MSDAAPTTARFAFGANWRRFLEDVDEDRIQIAVASLRDMLALDSLVGKTFLDAGCGSGLFSLAAAILGADQVHSFDYDADSVETTKLLKEQYAPEAPWTIERGDVTSEPYMTSLGKFDVVYSWGVLHHTGAMWRALGLTTQCVASDGRLFISIYNDQGPTSKRWRGVKRVYNRLPESLRTPYAVGVMLPWEARSFAKYAIRGRPGEYVRGWTEHRERGMSRWHDLLDWVGGYPFEVAKPEEVFRFCREHRLELLELSTAGGGLGCNQFVFRASRADADRQTAPAVEQAAS